MQLRMVSARQLIGRKIVGFTPGPTNGGLRGVFHTPRIYLDDGTFLYFVTEETDVAEYGTFIGKSKKRPKGRT